MREGAGLQSRQFRLGYSCETALIYGSRARGRYGELLQVEGKSARWWKIFLENLDRYQGMLDVSANEGFFRTRHGELHPQVFLCITAQLSADEANRAQRRGIPPVEPMRVLSVLRELVRDTALAEGNQGARFDDLGFVGGKAHDLDVAIDRLVEGHSRSENGDHVQGLLRMRIEACLGGGGESQFEPPAAFGCKPLEPERQGRLHEIPSLKDTPSEAILC